MRATATPAAAQRKVPSGAIARGVPRVIAPSPDMAQEIVIRLSTAEDADAIHSMIVALARATGLREKVTSQPQHFLRHSAGERPAFEAFIAERADAPVGLCLFFFSFSSWRGELGVYVQDLYVADAARGSGLGRRLIAETVRYASGQGATYLRLSVAKENIAAQKFYRSIGMTDSNEECIYQAAGPAFVRLGTAPVKP